MATSERGDSTQRALAEASPEVLSALRSVWHDIESLDTAWYEHVHRERHPAIGVLIDAPVELRISYGLELSRIIGLPSSGEGFRARDYHAAAINILAQLTSSDGVLTAAEVEMLIGRAETAERESPVDFGGQRIDDVMEPFLKFVERDFDRWTEAERARLRPRLQALATQSFFLGPRLRRLVRKDDTALPLHLLETDEDLGRRFAEVLGAWDDDHRVVTALIELFERLPASGKASPRWATSAREVAGELSDPVGLAGALIDALLAAGTVVNRTTHHGQVHEYEHFSGEINERFAVALLRFTGLLAAPKLLGPLRRTARHMLVVVGGQYGSARSVKLANAAVVAIADTAAPESLTELLALERTVRHGSLLNQIRKSIDALAAAQGVTRDELLERGVEAHGLGPDGARDTPLSRGTARIAVGGRAVTLTFVDEYGTEKKTFPADVKEADADAIAALKDELKGIRKTLAGERARIDALLATGASWAVADWQQYYLDHPITGRLTRDLIWRFAPSGDETEGIVGRPVDATTLMLDDGTTAPLPADTTVALWHPVLATPMAVGAWRQHCLDHTVVQPVKQAYREIYVVTPAERETATYSNRFAAHVFRQIQARALMKGRGWKAPPLAWWDDGRDFGTATRHYETAGLRAEFYYDPITEIQPDGDLYPLCTSDQVRFTRDGDDDPMRADEVPALIFSEALRDVDLFIGVTSIGADPEWEDRGDSPVTDRLQTYWNDFGFGELGASAQIRRELIAGLLPALAIADRLELEDRFLKVRGDLRTYRIHLGSGNIQMEPNAEYLCIVAARSAKASKLFLPLDDDPVLAVILSKAFLLADDSKITDRTILAPIRRA